MSAKGSALLFVTLLMFLFSAIAIAVAVVIRVEVLLAQRFRQSTEALYAARAALEVAVAELRPLPSWTAVVNGSQASAFTDGVVTGTKLVPDGGVVHVCCDAGSALDRLVIATHASPVPARRTLEWRAFLWTPFDRLVQPDAPSRLYLVVFVADNASASGEVDEDGDPSLLLHAVALGPDGIHRSVEALIGRPAQATSPDDAEAGIITAPSTSAVSIFTWREVRP